MSSLFDARGNRYLVVSPAELAALAVPVPLSPLDAARSSHQWTPAAVEAVCGRPARAGLAKPFRSDGLLVGPFESAAPFNLLIVNTDGSLAERSGNGLTIFATFLKDKGLAPPDRPFDLVVHFGADPPLRTQVEIGRAEGTDGVWISMGRPSFGPAAVEADGRAFEAAIFNGAACNRVLPIAALNPDWSTSLFVRVGNPHCVTVLRDPNTLPSWDDLEGRDLRDRLMAIANPVGEAGAGVLISPAGLNLQWAALQGPNTLAARVFERGEGPTRSSGTSAVAVAAAALRLGLVEGPELKVVMPGGTAPIRISPEADFWALTLFGVATEIAD